MKVKTNGGTRIVILTERLALKFPRVDSWRCFVQGLLSNMTEGQWRDFGNKHLCPIKYSNRFGLLVVMARAQEVTNEEKFKEDLSQLLEDESVGVDPCELGVDFFEYDGTSKNFGYIDGRLVKIDYGY
ncbi:hypothetical protein ACVV2V_002700 [Escherichia coli]